MHTHIKIDARTPPSLRAFDKLKITHASHTRETIEVQTEAMQTYSAPELPEKAILAFGSFLYEGFYPCISFLNSTVQSCRSIGSPDCQERTLRLLRKALFFSLLLVAAIFYPKSVMRGKEITGVP
jgi:hypothetical protein